MVRLELALNVPAKKPKSVAVSNVILNWDDILQFAINKTKAKSTRKKKLSGKKNQNLQLYIVKNSPQPAGTPLTPECATDGWDRYLVDGTMITLSNGNGYLISNSQVGKRDENPQAIKISLDISDTKIALPPRYPFPSSNSDKHLSASSEHGKDILLLEKPEEKDAVKPIGNHPAKDGKVDYHEGILSLEGNVLDTLLKVAKKYSHLGFTVSSYQIKGKKRGEYYAFDYGDGVKFPPVTDTETALLREFRGLLVSAHTGCVIARRFEKFFNLNQNEESQEKDIDFTDATYTLKIDGTLVSPVYFPGGDIYWLSRKTQIQVVDKFTSQFREGKCFDNQVEAWAWKYLNKGITPLLEWCTPSQTVGVIPAKKLSLTLLALRRMDTGEYLPLPKKETLPFPIQLVQTLSVSDLMDVRNWKDQEGVVIETLDKKRYKLKSNWYVQMASCSKIGGISKILPRLTSWQNIPAYYMWQFGLSPPDDIISLLHSYLPEEEIQAFADWQRAIEFQLTQLGNDLHSWITQVIISHSPGVAKDILLQAGWKNGETLVTNVQKSGSSSQSLIPHLRKMCLGYANSKLPAKINILEFLLYLSWDETLGRMSSQALITEMGNVTDCNLIKFQPASDHLRNHVLDTYLYRKLSQLSGIKDFGPEDSWTLGKNYLPDEGKIKGYWEEFISDNIWDLRIDLQKSSPHGYTHHLGDCNYGLLLVQYGLFGNPKHKPHGEFAGTLIPVGVAVTGNMIEDALRLSFEHKKVTMVKVPVTISPQVTSASSFQGNIYCDLDQVLADFETGVYNLTGRKCKDQSSKKMWQRILSHTGFFQTLPWMEEGKDTWELVKSLDPDVKILSGIPVVCKKQVHREKKNWVMENLGKEVEIITCPSTDKKKYSQVGKILIDDWWEAKKPWELSGGTFIHHSSLEWTRYQLNRLMGKLPRCTMDSMDSIEKLDPLEVIMCLHSDVLPDWNTLQEVAIDLEWNPLAPSDHISLVQIATLDKIYLLDMVAGDATLIDSLHELLLNRKVIKIFFGADSGDISRLNTKIYSALDLQELITDQMEITSTSLGEVAESILGIKMEKSKEFQAGNWDLRPLPSEFISYAAKDAQVTWKLYQALQDTIQMPIRNFYPPNCTSRVVPSKSDLDLTLPVTVRYSGVFLTEATQKQILTWFPPKFSTASAHHITLHYQPSESDLRGLLVGDKASFQITGYYSDSQGEVLRVKFQTPVLHAKDQHLHLTLSHHSHIDPSIFNRDVEWKKVEDYPTLTGKIGLLVEEKEDTLALLPAKIKDKIIQFQDNAEVGQHLKFHPSELSSAQRAIIHQYAEKNWMESNSSGKGDRRKMQLTLRRKASWEQVHMDDSGKIFVHGQQVTDPKQYKKVMSKGVKVINTSVPKLHRITDFYQFSVLRIVDSKLKTHLPISGKITSHGLEDFVFPLIGKLPTLCILRGLPGSGKSCLAKLLTSHYPSIASGIASADDFFSQVKGEYHYDREKIKNAHQACQEKVKSLIASKSPLIIVDNTHSTLKEYVVYQKIGKAAGYNILILEIACPDKNTAITFCHRNTHQVPIKESLKMLARWETDDQAKLLLSQLTERKIDISSIRSEMSLQRWLSENKMFHFTQKRHKTHLWMAIGDKPATFVDIPSDREEEFRKVYLASESEPKFLMELLDPEEKEFNFFLDIDYLSSRVPTIEYWEAILIDLHSLLPGEVYLAGNLEEVEIVGDQVKVGLHLHAYQHRVTTSQAVELRLQVIELLNKKHPEASWEYILDSEVYVGNRGIRMIGSRKVTKGIDKGRIYSLLLYKDKSGKIERYPEMNLEALQKCSIHI